jgi:Holliday junction DNA helicase RuvA
MIYSLTGNVESIKSNFVELVVNGVGYKVSVSQLTSSQLTSGSGAKLFIHQHFSQDSQSLFGFLGEADLELFEKMLGVNGVGPKTGLVIMDKGNSAVIKAIASADLAFFESIKGIGKKTAQRILVDLKGVLVQSEAEVQESTFEAYSDLTQGLSQLGFAAKEIRETIKKMPADRLTLQEQLQWCLRNIK